MLLLLLLFICIFAADLFLLPASVMLVSQCRLIDLQQFIQLGHLSLANLPLLEPTERFSMLNTVDSDSNVIIILI